MQGILMLRQVRIRLRPPPRSRRFAEISWSLASTPELAGALPGPDLHRLIAPALPGAFHLFDHLVGECEQFRRNSKPERFGGLDVDGKFEFGRLYDRQVGRLRTSKYFSNVNSSLAIRVILPATVA